MDIETELPTQVGVRLKKAWTAPGLEAPFLSVFPYLCLFRHKTETLQSNSNLRVTLGDNYVPSSPDLNAFHVISGVLTKKKKKHNN